MKKDNEHLINLNNRLISEQEDAKIYVLTKKLSRPKTNLLTLLLILLIYILCGLLTGFILTKLLNIKNKQVYIYIFSYVLLFYIFLKLFCLKIIECYQHYAKEDIRRKCLCKPTCSEYAIAVLKKYPTVTALRKIYYRLFKTCKGEIYKIDLP